MKTNYSYNAITNTLTVSAAFLKNAANLHSKEYEIIRTLRADHGEITIVTEERRKSVSRAMTFKQMEMHIKQCRDSEKRLFDRRRRRKVGVAQTEVADCIVSVFLFEFNSRFKHLPDPGRICHEAVDLFCNKTHEIIPSLKFFFLKYSILCNIQACF